MASKPGVLSHFPWESMGNYKYALFLPFMAVVATGVDDGDNWCWHMCALAAARYALAQGFMTASRVHAISGQSRIQVTLASKVPPFCTPRARNSSHLRMSATPAFPVPSQLQRCLSCI